MAITGCDKTDCRTDEICEQLLHLGPRIIALKMGPAGSYIYTRNGGVSIPPASICVTDTTGAGDVFDAGFVFGHLKGWDLEKTGRFANAAAAISTTGFGIKRYPSHGAVLDLAGLSI